MRFFFFRTYRGFFAEPANVSLDSATKNDVVDLVLLEATAARNAVDPAMTAPCAYSARDESCVGVVVEAAANTEAPFLAPRHSRACGGLGGRLLRTSSRVSRDLPHQTKVEGACAHPHRALRRGSLLLVIRVRGTVVVARGTWPPFPRRCGRPEGRSRR